MAPSQSTLSTRNGAAWASICPAPAPRIPLSLLRSAIVGFAKTLSGVGVCHPQLVPTEGPCVFYANHASMADLLLIWSTLPRRARTRARPVAGADFWLASRPRAFIARSLFDAVLIDRDAENRAEDPVERMIDAIDRGASLILFPEGTRNTSERLLLPFKSGLYHLANARPNVPLLPVWLSNPNRLLPKGKVLPVPYLCTVKFGPPIKLSPKEGKEAFLSRATRNLSTLAHPCEAG